jgi:2-polyprenyl-3-methyl-5-hydroxy-6-metoxy-1,4-benzoquinol methylase
MTPSPSGESKQVATYFDTHAQDFDHIYDARKGRARSLRDRLSRGVVVRRLEFVRELGQQHHFERALDVGCGAGRFGIELAKQGTTSVGLDFAPEMIELAGRHAAAAGVTDKTSFLVEDFVTWEVPGTFDLALAIGVVDYVSEPGPILAKLAAVSSGRIVVSFPKRWHPLVPVRWARLRAAKCPVFFYTRADVERLAAAHAPGARIVDFGRDNLLVGAGL